VKYKLRDVKFREGVIGFMLGPDKDETGSLEQATTLDELTSKIGMFCKGKDITECRKYFGTGLARVCATCPN
jgi:hypothetical protein